MDPRHPFLILPLFPDPPRRQQHAQDGALVSKALAPAARQQGPRERGRRVSPEALKAAARNSAGKKSGRRQGAGARKRSKRKKHDDVQVV